ncbi:MAG: segregation/condensation protein A [Candidatus Aureabacteria bacterium]|nr:segregation/condensation protein A [Candidatus Auribacterota bacterium]
MTTSNKKEKYKVKLELFEGPLDLLLYLIKKSEVDIYDIPIESITKQYLDYMDLIKELNLNNVGEFILLASQLIYIKSQMLLPEDERGEEDEFEDPRMELVHQLLEYRKFKNAAFNLDSLQKEESKRFPRFAKIAFEESNTIKKLDVSIFELLEAFSKILDSKDLSLMHIESETITVAEKIAEFQEILKNDIQVSFNEIFKKAHSKMELICSFLAVLELIKQGEIKVIQNENFGEIILQRTMH